MLLESVQRRGGVEMIRGLVAASIVLSLIAVGAGQAPTRGATPFTLAQVWKLDATYTDLEHGMTFR